jgi:hypothetical protein
MEMNIVQKMQLILTGVAGEPLPLPFFVLRLGFGRAPRMCLTKVVRGRYAASPPQSYDNPA